MFSTAALVLSGLLLAPFAVADVHDIWVGGADGQLEYSPDAISAQVGDQVVFHFQQKNHTVTQSSFASPCGLKEGGFNSGFMPVAANVTDNFPTFTITVNDTNPIWAYCAQGANTAASHCGKGMVVAINCGADGSANSFTNFKNSALAIGAQLAAAASSASPAAAATGAPSSDSGYGSSYGAPAAAPPPAASSGTDSGSDSSESAATPSATSAATGTAANDAAGATHTVTVGANGQLAFSPEQLSAAVGDVVLFQFQAKNHTVTQSSFATPCLKFANATTGAIGFNSGFMPVPANSTDFPTFSITVSDTNPIWAYCAQKTPSSHCGAGMVIGINSNESSPKNFSAFQALAMQQNGTASNATNTTSAGTTQPTTSGAFATKGSLGVVVGVAGALFALLL